MWYYGVMARKIIFGNEEIYHIYNRGTDKRPIFSNMADVGRFIESMQLMNSISPIKGIKHFHQKKNQEESEPLVEILAYSLLDNHFHLLLKQTAPDGISKFMHRLGSGYTTYFNLKHNRSGSLFQGPFKAKHIDSDAYLAHVTAYVHANHYVHRFKGWKIDGKYTHISSLTEYTKENPFRVCNGLFDPTGGPRDTFAQWCITHAQQVAHERADYPWMIE